MIKFFKKYDWVKIVIILLILAWNILSIVGIASLFSTCTKNSDSNNTDKMQNTAGLSMKEEEIEMQSTFL